jgi:pimeloyl-ACP methyl ester carboxylesterase
MPELHVDGARVHYDVHASTAEEHGTEGLPVLLTHGLWMDSGMWAANTAALARGRRVATWDIRGHGQTRTPLAPSSYSEERCLDDMAGILDALDAPRAVLGGHSLGGYLSLSFTLRNPGRVVALVLCSTGPGFRDPAARERWNDRVHVQTAGQESESALAARGIAVFRDSHVIDSLGSIDVPALVVVGDDDPAYDGAARYLARKLPKAQLAVVSGAGHAPNVDQPEQFDDLVRAFLATCA